MFACALVRCFEAPMMNSIMNQFADDARDDLVIGE